MPLGTYNYYNRVTQLQGSVKETQKFYRFFPYPGNVHCLADPADFPNAPQINSNDLFNVNWVEHGVAPDLIVASNASGGTRPICKYPDIMVYNGSGNLFDESNFHCQTETADALISADVALPDPGAQGH